MLIDLRSLRGEYTVAHGGKARVEVTRITNLATFGGIWDFIDYVRIPPGASIGLHAHAADEEVYVILRGRGIAEIDGREYRVGEGHLLVNPPFGQHSLLNDGDSCLELLVLQVPVRRTEL